LTRKTSRLKIVFQRRDGYGGIAENFNETTPFKRSQYAILNQQQVITFAQHAQ
jgi:hypothetical protein